MVFRILLTLMLALHSPLILFAAAPPVVPPPTPDEEFLRTAGLATDKASLLGFFRWFSPTPAESQRRAKLLRDLGNNSFRIRTEAAAELVRAGPGVVPLLRQGIKNPDREVVRQARRCLVKLLNVDGPAFAEAAARLVARDRPPGAIPVLLRYLPFADDEAVIREVRRALVVLHAHCTLPDQALLAGMADKKPACRAAAAYVLGQWSGLPPKSLARLLDDPVAEVRLEAALALVLHKDKSGIPALLALLANPSLPIAWQAERMLLRVAANRAPTVALQGTPASRGRVLTDWKSWWKEHGGKVDLATCTLKDPDVYLLYTELDRGRVVALDSNWNEYWAINDLNGPADVQILSSGRFLIAENHGQLVTERDLKGRIVWQFKTEFYPVSCWRLENGNTVITSKVDMMEITPTGKTVWSRRVEGRLAYARRLRDKRIAVLDIFGHFSIWTAEGKDDATIPSEMTLAGRTSFIELPNGHFLVAGRRKFGGTVEVSRRGEHIWSGESQVTGSAAVLLPNGHLCVTDSEMYHLYEYDRAGKQHRQKKLKNQPWHLQVVR